MTPGASYCHRGFDSWPEMFGRAETHWLLAVLLFVDRGCCALPSRSKQGMVIGCLESGDQGMQQCFDTLS